MGVSKAKSVLGKINIKFVPKQRVTALFFTLVMVFSVFVQTGTALAVYDKLGNNPKKQTENEEQNLKPQDVKPFSQKVESKNKPAADVLGNSSKDDMPFPLNDVAQQQPENEDVPFRPEDYDEFIKKKKQTEKSEEVLSERTATSTTFTNPDGTTTVTEFATPQFYKQGDEWKEINTNLEEDYNPDNSNLFATGFNKAKSFFTDSNSYVVNDNEWIVKFNPVSKDGGRPTIQIEKDGKTIDVSPVSPDNNVDPKIVYDNGQGKQTVRYENVWHGVHLEYLVSGTNLKENIVITNKDVRTEYEFNVVGAGLEKTDDGGFKLHGELGEDFTISPLIVSAWKRGVISERVAWQDYNDGSLKINIDPEFLQSVEDENFPVVIDPTFNSSFGTRTSGDYKSYKSDTTECEDSSICEIHAGALDDRAGNIGAVCSSHLIPSSKVRN